MVKVGDVFSTEGVKYGNGFKGMWAMIKVPGKRFAKGKGGPITVWVTNPIDIKDSSKFWIKEIVAVEHGFSVVGSNWYSNVNVQVIAGANPERIERGQFVTPQDDLNKLFGL